MNDRKTRMLWIGIAVSAVCLAFSLRGTDPSEVARALSHADGRMAVPLLILFGLYFWLKALRWRALLAPVRRAGVAEVFAPMMVGFAGNNVLPAHLGELVRVHLVSRRTGAEHAAVLATVATERLFDLAAVAALVGLAVWSEAGPLPGRVAALALAGACALGVPAAALLVRRRPGLPGALLARAAGALPARFRDTVRRQALLAAVGARALRRPGTLVFVAATSLLQWALMGGCVQIGVEAVGVEVPLSAGFAVMGLTVAGLTLPTAPGFFGTIELCFAAGLSRYGVPAGDALAAAVFYHALTWASVTLCGLACLSCTGGSLWAAGQAAEPGLERGGP